MLSIIRVTGDSMLPTLADNDYVVVSRLLSPRINRLVVIDHPIYQQMIKRIEAVDTQGTLRLTGDNSTSLSAEQMGDIDPKWVKGVVLFSIKNPRNH